MAEKAPPVSVFYKHGRGLLRQCACQVQCPACGSWATFALPQSGYKGEVRVYGDEAFRTVDGKSVLVYSFVSFVGGSTSKKSFEQELRYLKQQIAPSVPPDAWVLHMTELLSPEKRAKQGHLRHLDGAQARDSAERVMGHIAGSSLTGELQIHVAIGIAEKVPLTSADRQACQENVYSAALLRVIQQMTQAGLAPMFYFERTQSDGWAKNLFDGGRLTLVWAYITNGLPVMSPQFVAPAFSPYLEVADIVSYVVARHLYCLGRRAEGVEAEPDWSPSLLGQITYIFTEPSGDWRYLSSVEFPKKEFFGGTLWAR